MKWNISRAWYAETRMKQSEILRKAFLILKETLEAGGQDHPGDSQEGACPA